MRHLQWGVLALGLFISERSASAQEATGEPNCIDDVSQLKHVRTKVVDGITIIEDKLVICGKPKKPLALVVTRGKPINYEWENQRPDFMKKVHESLKQPPF